MALLLLPMLFACGGGDSEAVPDASPSGDMASVGDPTAQPEAWDDTSLEPVVDAEIFLGDSFEFGGDVPKMFDDMGNELDVAFSATLTGNGVKHLMVTGTIVAGKNRAKCYTWETTYEVTYEDGSTGAMTAGSYVIEYRAYNPLNEALQQIGTREVLIQASGG